MADTVTAGVDHVGLNRRPNVGLHHLAVARAEP